MVTYPEPYYKYPYVLDPRDYCKLAPEFSSILDQQTQVVRVYGWPYRVIAEAKQPSDPKPRNSAKIRWQYYPWRSVKPPRSTKRIAAKITDDLGILGRSPTQAEKDEAKRDSTPPPDPFVPKGKRRSLRLWKTQEPAAKRSKVDTVPNGQQKQTPDTTLKPTPELEPKIKPKAKTTISRKSPEVHEVATPEVEEDDGVEQDDGGKEYDSDAKSELDINDFTDRYGKVYPHMDRIRQYPKSRKLRTMGKRWRQQSDRRIIKART